MDIVDFRRSRAVSVVARHVLSLPWAFDWYQRVIGAPACQERFLRDFVQPLQHERLLDIGCGVGGSVAFISEAAAYLGVDINPDYVRLARTRFPSRRFLCADATNYGFSSEGVFDRAFAFGVLHHLSDTEVGRLASNVASCLAPGGRFITIDPCFVPGQSAFARFLIRNDRGRNVRTEAGYLALLSPAGEAGSIIVSDALRIPYTMAVCVLRVP